MHPYSHSRLSCYEQCPLKFRFVYIDELETEIEETVEAFLGHRVHEVLHKLYRDIKFQKLLTLKELLDFFNAEWRKNWNDAIIIVKEDYSEENYRKMGERFITDFYNRYEPFDQDRTIATEKKVLINLGSGYLLRGYIDRLACDGNTYIIHDYKTANSLPSNSILDTDRQLALYCIAVRNDYPDCKNVKLVWHYLAFDKELSGERTDGQLEALKKDTIRLINEIESAQDFPARKSPLCDWCEFQALCPSFKHLHQLESKPDNEFLSDDGVKLVNEYAKATEEAKQIEERLEKLREALILFAKKEGIDTVYGSDVKAWVKSYPRLSFPKRNDPQQKPFIEAIKSLGLWDSLATVDVYELAKRINRGEIHEELLKLLEKYITKTEFNMVRLGRG